MMVEEGMWAVGRTSTTIFDLLPIKGTLDQHSAAAAMSTTGPKTPARSGVLDSFRKWLEANDVHFHPALFFAHDATCGTSLFTRDALPAGSCAIDLPSRLPITSDFSSSAILEMIGITDPEEQRQARKRVEESLAVQPSDWTILHLVWVRHLLDLGIVQVTDEGEVCYGAVSFPAALPGGPQPGSSRQGALPRLLWHAPYIQAIPYPDIALTPLHFTAAELNLLRGTSLYGATLLRRQRGDSLVAELSSWLHLNARDEADKACLSALSALSTSSVGPSTLQQLWRWADTSFGSRSFPPRLVGVAEEDEADFGVILIPGLDSFNHQRGRPVTWKHDDGGNGSAIVVPEGRTKLILDSPTAAGEQVFNNYGAKSSEELLGSYGFVLSEPAARQDDALGLVVSSGPQDTEASAQRHWWRYSDDQGPPPALIADIQTRLRQQEPGKEAPAELSELEQIEEDGEVFEALEEMLRARLARFLQGPQQAAAALDNDLSRPSDADGGQVRARVVDMIKVYRDGQEAILTQAIAWCGRALEDLEARWDQLGGDD